MKETSVILSPWDDVFKELLASSNTLDFTSPFITRSGVEHVLERRLDVRGITDMVPDRFVRMASDILALKSLIDYGAAMKSLRSLHAKVFIFDDSAVVTSANLTEGGLRRNIEYGVILHEKHVMSKIKSNFEKMYDEGADIDNDDIVFVMKIIQNTPTEMRELQVRTTREQTVSRHIILESLSGWKKEVYRVIAKLPRDNFTLEEVLAYTHHFAKLYPDNQNIEAKIRQTLQFLRDLSLIDFIDYKGSYRRIAI